VSATGAIAEADSPTPKAKRPTASSRVKVVSETTIAVSVRPAMSTHAGTGVA
jgi:hypothetical protein